MSQQHDQPISIEHAFSLAKQHHQAGQLQQAEAIYRSILSVQPNHADALHHLGVIALHNGRFAAAIELIRAAISHKSSESHYYTNLGLALAATGDFINAVAAHHQAIALQPQSAGAYYNLGIALQALRQHDEAIAAYRQAIAYRPHFARAYSNLGTVLRVMSCHDEAIEAFRMSISLDPTVPAAHYNLGTTLLLQGNYTEGFAEYEFRKQTNELNPPRADYPKPQWDGADLHGRRILIHAEQGLGDMMQFVRFLPLVAQCGGRIILTCRPELLRLMKSLKDVEKVVLTHDPIPDYDVQCALLSLPHIFKTTIENIPCSTSAYIQADPVLAKHWQARLKDFTGRLKVGLVWAAGRGNPDDRDRSISLGELASLPQTPDIAYFSLQKGVAASESAASPFAKNLIDWTADLHDFADTAALVDNLDLIISVDTAVVHLAGAMGKPTWVFVPFLPDWRWMLNRPDSLWYSTVRIFRQSQPNNWSEVILAVAQSLVSLGLDDA